MPSNRTAEARSVHEEPPARALPYEPSVPCADCARGVDPLRAACLLVTDQSVRYFCSRACRESYRERERSHAVRSVQAARPVERPSLPVSLRPSLPPIARRIAPARPATARWPLAAGALAAALSLTPSPGARELSALALLGVSAVFASRTAQTRSHGGLVAWLSVPLGVALLALAALLGDRPSALWAAKLGIGLMYLREHFVERAEAEMRAQHAELSGLLAPRARVSLPPPTARPSREPSGPRSIERPLATLRVGDEVLVEAPDALPVDGVVSEGEAAVLPYPHARAPIQRRPGSAVLAGAVLVDGALRVRATRVGPARALFRIFTADDAEAEPTGSATIRLIAWTRSPLARALYLALVAGIALALARGVAAALAATGAALLALPTLSLARSIRWPWRVALLRAAWQGVCFRDAGALERAGRVDTALVRVEGVLVSRDHRVRAVLPLSDSLDADALLAIALAAEAVAETHPIALALRQLAEERGVRPASLRRLAYTRGQGIRALLDGQGEIVLGSRAALLAAGVSVAAADREAHEAEQRGDKVVFLAIGGHVRGLFALSQPLRPEARIAVQRLTDLGLEVALIASEHRPTVEALARTLAVARARGELASEQRVAELEHMHADDARIVAVGRVPEDAPLFAAADLSLALDAAGLGGDQDITTAAPDLRDAAAALAIARAAQRHVRRLLSASAAGLGLSLLAAGGLAHPVATALFALGVDWVCLAYRARSSQSGADQDADAAPEERSQT